MREKNNYFKLVCWVCVCVFIITGCSNNRSTEEKIFMEGEKEEVEEEKMEEPEMDSSNVSIEADTEDSTENIIMEPEIASADWSEYFNGLNGTAVVYDISNRRYTVYNSDLALTRSSPCSTFKIISSLIALENGIFEPEDSTRDWSGEIFWNEDWNKDIDFTEAFRTSCVWYYRQVIDDIGKDMYTVCHLFIQRIFAGRFGSCRKITSVFMRRICKLRNAMMNVITVVHRLS